MRERKKEIEKRWGWQKESARDRMKKMPPSMDRNQCSIDPFQLVFLVVKMPSKIIESNENTLRLGRKTQLPPWGAGGCCHCLSQQALDLLHHPGEHFRGSLMDEGIPLICLSLEWPVGVLYGVGGSTAGPVCVREDGCLLPLTRGYPWNLLPPVFWEGVCVNLASVGYGLPHPNPTREESQHDCRVWLSFFSLFTYLLRWVKTAFPLI